MDMTHVTVAFIGLLSGSISSVVSYFITKYNINKPKQINALEEQYANVLVPIHKILFFNNDKAITDDMIFGHKQKSIEDVLNKNYHLSPYGIVEEFKRAVENEDMKDFEELINNLFQSASYRLGYTQKSIKIDRETLLLLASSAYSPERMISLLIKRLLPL